MTLRTKLLLAQAPLAVALALLAAIFSAGAARLGANSSHILADNYRSVLAAQRMKEAIERIDSAALFLVAGRETEGASQIAANQRAFEQELQSEEQNITETGEAPAAQALRASWTEYLARLERYRALSNRPALTEEYFRQLAPAFDAVKAGADQILAINQDAMVRKSARAQREARSLVHLMIAAATAVALLGIWASGSITARLLHPMRVVKQAMRRFGEGDLAARAQVRARDEIGELARDFNAMAESLERYRNSSLGELLQAQRASQAAIDSLPDPVVMFGLYEVLNVNEAATRLLGIGAEAGARDALGRCDPAVRAMLERVRAHVLSGRGAFQPTSLADAVPFISPDGERRLLPRAAPIYGEEGEVAGVAIVLQDVTRLLRADELKSDLVAFVAHEFRTPLTSLQMAVHLCAEGVAGPLTDKQADLLFEARRDCERLKEIVDDLLDASRMQEGRLELNVAPVDVEAIVAEVITEYEAEAQQRAIALRSEVLPGTGAVLADGERVRLVLGNLVTNALRHTPARGRIVLRAVAANAQMRFEVSDTGKGIPREQQALVFEKFYRVPGERGEGVGLGLYMSRQIVQAHGGAMGVENASEGGATFWFTLPRATENVPRA